MIDISYLQDYITRVSRYGSNEQERAQYFVRKECSTFIEQSPTREMVLINGREIECSIQSNRFKDEETTRYLVTHYYNIFPLGSLVQRTRHDEVWMLLRHEPHAFDGDNRYVIIELKHSIQWVDSFGVLNMSPCMIVGSMDSKIKENFRTWNSMITPQPNKVLEVIMPYQFIKRNTKIISNQEAWYLVDYDKQTIPGIVYLSFTESAINIFDDESSQDIADKDKIGLYSIISMQNPLMILPNIATKLPIKTMRNGVHIVEPIQCTYDPERISLDGDYITISEVGEYQIHISLTNQPHVYLDLPIVCTESEYATDYTLNGDNIVKWGNNAFYQVSRMVNGNEEILDVFMEVDDLQLAFLLEENNGYRLYANEDNKTGIITISAEVDDKILKKQVRISSLWS